MCVGWGIAHAEGNNKIFEKVWILLFIKLSFVNCRINTFTTNFKWQFVRVVIGGQKSNFSSRFKLESITT